MNELIYAVDFDGTLFEDRYPDIGEPNRGVIEHVKSLRAAGHKIILWTCRCGRHLRAAEAVCRRYGLEFDAVNDNLESNKKKYGNNCRKVFADVYLDDKAAGRDVLALLESNYKEATSNAD